MIDAVPLLLAATTVLWHPATSPEPACRCERPGEQWSHTQADPVRLAPGAQAAWVSDGSRLFVASARPFEVERARWLVTVPGERAYWAEPATPSPQLMTRGARLLSPRTASGGAASPGVQSHRVSYSGGRYADALSVAAGSRLEFDVPGERELLLELIDPGATRGSRQVGVGWDGGALSTRTVTWREPGTTPGARLQRIPLSPPAGSRRLMLVALDDVVLRVLAQRWHAPAAGSAPAVSFWHSSANDAIARARDNDVDPASRWQVADEARSGRQSFFRSLLPTGGESGVRLEWHGYLPLPDEQGSGTSASPGEDAEFDADLDAATDTGEGAGAVAGAGGEGRHPWLQWNGEPVDYELPPRTADSVLRVFVRGPAGELRIRFDDQAPLRMQLRERGPLESPGTLPADGSARVLLPASVRRLRIEATPGQSLEISLAYRTARSYRLSASAYRQLLASTDAASLFRSRLRQSPDLRAGQLDAAPSADQELLNHWAPLLRRLPEDGLRTRSRPTGDRCAAPYPEVSGSLGRRLLVQQALFGCSRAQRQAGWERLSARTDLEGETLAVAVAALAEDGSADHWQWLAEAVRQRGWEQWSLDVAQVAGLAWPDLPPQTPPALPARVRAAGAVPEQARGSERLGWLWRATSAQPLAVGVPPGSRRVELTVRALPGAHGQWLPVRVDGTGFAALALPGLSWSSDLLDARTRRPLPAAERFAMDLPAGAAELVIEPNVAEVLVSARWYREPAGSSEGPVVILDSAQAGTDIGWAARYRFDHSGDAQALLAMLRAASASGEADTSGPGTYGEADSQAARALAWVRPGRWERLAIPEGGAGYRDIPAAPTPGERLLRGGQTLRGRVPGAGRYRLTSRWHGPAADSAARLVGTWGELPVGQASQSLVLAEDAPWQMHLLGVPDSRQASVRIEREQAGRWSPLAVDAASARWWIATRLEPVTVYWPEPAVVRVTTLRAGKREEHWQLVAPDRPLQLSPAPGHAERLLQVHIWRPGTRPPPPAQPGPSAESWRPGTATAAAPAAGDIARHPLPAHAWTDAVNVSLARRPEAEDAAASAGGSANWQLAWQRYRHLPGQQSFVGVEMLARTADRKQAVGGSAFFDWQPANSIWSASIDADVWWAESRSVVGLRATGRADWTYGARWDHQFSVSGQLWHGPGTALDDSGIWSSYRAHHRRAVTLEDRWRWWLSPASHGVARLQWRSNEDLSRDQGSAWLGWQVASGRWSGTAEAGLRWLAADADRAVAARKPTLRLGVDFWQPVGSHHGLVANLGLQFGEDRADRSIGLELTWFRHEGRGMDDFSPRRFRFLELRQGRFMAEQP